MPQAPDLSKYLNAGAEFVALTRAQARERASELVAQGQLAQNQVQGFVDGLVEESRRRTDLMMDLVRQEIQRQVQSVGIATKDDLARLEAKLAKQAQAAKSSSGPKRAKKSGAKKSGAKKSKNAAKKSKKSKKAAGAGSAKADAAAS